jgi:radical SAM protein with 4Fe4S-binding SPASM domain
LSAAECVELEATDRASANEMIEAALRGLPAENDGNFYCKSGKAAFAVNPYGDMNVCLLLPLPAARPLENGFQAAWQQVAEYVDAAPVPSPVCRACDAKVYCGRCPAWSLMETGTLSEPVPLWCDIARARKDRYRGGRPKISV